MKESTISNDKIKIGAITIGQSPRVDVTADIMDIFPNNVELLEAGGLDGLTKEDIKAFAPTEDDYVLVSRLKDGSSVVFAEKHILPMLQNCIDRLEEEGCKIILFFCTGTFPDTLQSKRVPLVYPCDILDKIVPLLTKKSDIICLTPDKSQVEQTENKWKSFVSNVTAVPASPYNDFDEIVKATEKIKKLDGDLVVLDCIGYTSEMKKYIAEETGKMVVLPRTLLARVASEVLSS